MLSLSGTEANLFEIVDTELFLKADTVLDFETSPNLNVTVEVDDSSVGSSPDDTDALTLSITDINDIPDVALTNATASLSEAANTTSAIRVADIVVMDDALGANVLSLSGDDAAMFEISGDELHLKAGAALDAETNPTLNVTVEVDDNAVGNSPDGSVDLQINITPLLPLSSNWSALGSGMNSYVSTLAFDDNGNLYAGGNFTTAGGETANYIAKWDGNAWSTLGSGVSSGVYVLNFDHSGNLYAGGSFSTAGGETANRIAKWDGNSWSTLGTGMNAGIYALAFDNNAETCTQGDFSRLRVE